MFLSKIAHDDSLSWYISFGTAYGDTLVDITIVAGGGTIFAAGYIGLNDTFLAAFGLSGELYWAKHIDISGLEKYPTAATDIGFSYFLAGDYLTLGGSFMLGFSISGDLTWANNYNKDVPGFRIQRMIDTSTQKLLVSGMNDMNPFIMLLDTDGSIIWSYVYDFSIMLDAISASFETKDGGFGVALKMGVDSYVLRIDSNGNVETVLLLLDYTIYDGKVLDGNDEVSEIYCGMKNSPPKAMVAATNGSGFIEDCSDWKVYTTPISKNGLSVNVVPIDLQTITVSEPAVDEFDMSVTGESVIGTDFPFVGPIESQVCEKCVENYYGDYCYNTTCFGIDSGDPNVCEGHGDCISFGKCSCKDNFYGTNCSISTCFGFLQNHTEDALGPGLPTDFVCLGRGSCDDYNKCTCFLDESIVTEPKDMYIGDNCNISVCYEIPGNEEDVCSSHGECILYNECECEDDYYGISCLENIKAPYFTDYHLNVLKMEYVLGKTSFYDFEKEKLANLRFDCSRIIFNWEDFLIHNSSYCYFEFREIIGGIFYSINFFINIANYEEIYGTDKPNENTEKLIDYEIPDNYTIQLITVTVPEKVVSFQVEKYISVNNNNNNNGENDIVGDDPVDLTWLYVSLPVSFVIIIFVSICVVLTLICLMVCCCCCLCFALCFFVCLCLCGGCCCSALVVNQTKKISRFKELDNFDLLLKEQELGKNSTNARITINKGLFEIDSKKIKLLSILGEGGSNSTVYKSDWNGKIVAFKCFKTRSICNSQNSFDEFEREANLLASISHPNIIQFFGCCLKPPRVGFIMEFCENGDITAYILALQKEGKRFLIQEKLRMFCEICSGMAYLHQRKVIHRDLKLENVLLNSSLNCKIMDFGISRIFDETKQLKTKGIGTSLYIAPEMLIGSTYNEKIDIFSFGILLWIVYYEDMSPYGDQNSAYIENRVASNPYFRPKYDENIPIPEWFKNLITSCLEHEPEKRNSFSEIFEYLEKNSEKENTNTKSDSNVLEEEEIYSLEDQNQKSIYIYIKLKNQDKSKAERFYLLKRSFSSLLIIVQEKYPKSQIKRLFLSKTNIAKQVSKMVEMEELSNDGQKIYDENDLIETDEDVRQKLSSGCLIDVEEFDERDTVIMNLQGDLEDSKKRIEELQRELRDFKKD